MKQLDVITYLDNYPHTLSTTMDVIFPYCKADVSHLAKLYKQGEAYIYTKDEYIEYLEEKLKSNLEYHKNTGLSDTEAFHEESDLNQLLVKVKNSIHHTFIETIEHGYYCEL